MPSEFGRWKWRPNWKYVMLVTQHDMARINKPGHDMAWQYPSMIVSFHKGLACSFAWITLLILAIPSRPLLNRNQNLLFYETLFRNFIYHPCRDSLAHYHVRVPNPPRRHTYIIWVKWTSVLHLEVLWNLAMQYPRTARCTPLSTLAQAWSEFPRGPGPHFSKCCLEFGRGVGFP